MKNVYIAFRYPRSNASGWRTYDDWIMFTPSWDPGFSYDLNKEFNPKNADTGRTRFPEMFTDPNHPTPGTGSRFRGNIKDYWQPYWASKLNDVSLAMGERKFDDFGSASRVSIPMLSFFSRLEPQRNENPRQPNRFEFLRRGARRYDCSAALGAGALVVVAEADESVPIPVPLFVEGQQVNGSGNTVYQFVLPIDAGSVWAPSTQPSDTN